MQSGPTTTPSDGIHCAYPLLDPELRSVLEKVLRVQCIVPSFLCGRNGNTARCLLEENSNTNSTTETLSLSSMTEASAEMTLTAMLAEDVVCTIMPRGKNHSIGNFNSAESSAEAIYFSDEILKQLLGTFFSPLPHINLSTLKISSVPLVLSPCLFSNVRHPGIATIYNLIETDKESILLQKYLKDSIPTLSRFSTAMSCASLAREAGEGAKDMRLRFVIYQLLQVVAYTHSQGLCVDLASPQEVTLSDNIWITLGMKCSTRMMLAAECVAHLRQYSSTCNAKKVDTSKSGSQMDGCSAMGNDNIQVHDDIEDDDVDNIQPGVCGDGGKCNVGILLDASRVRTLLGGGVGQGSSILKTGTETKKIERTDRSKTQTSPNTEGCMGNIERPPSYYEPITLKWVTGKISNLEYLMVINAAAGRHMMDPTYHPVLPWVTDFTSSALGVTIPVCPMRQHQHHSHLRDLTKTKFRLSKGDRQLATTFEHSNPPHHIPEILSELTYYIYMARRTPMQILKRIVRGYFVADHYPHSMVRMYNWTPDECAPEFYTDVTVFESIHKAHGLENIELPDFAPTPHEFIRYHRAVLESDDVSKQLHHWINLNFGHQLLGEEAMQNLNVPLIHALSKQQELGGTPDLEGHPGFRILFNHPHPKKDVGFGQANDDSRSHSGRGSSSDNSSTNSGHYRALPTHTSNLRTNRNIQSMLEMGETYGIVTTPYPDVPSESVSKTKKNSMKYLSEGNKEDASLVLLKFAQTGRMDTSNVSDNRWYRAEAMKFSACYGTLLEPCYEMPLVLSTNVKRDANMSSSSIMDKDFTAQMEEYYEQPLSEVDAAFVSEMDKLCLSAKKILSSPPLSPACASSNARPSCELDDDDRDSGHPSSDDNSVTLSPKEVIRLLQAQDMFALGCLIAEIFTGKPLLSKEDTASLPCSADMQAILHKNIMQCSSLFPLNIRRIVLLLTHPQPVYRPSAEDILQHCCVDEREINEPIAEVHNGVLFFATGEQPTLLFQKVSPVLRQHLLEDFCNLSFPAHFQDVYIFIGRLKIARDGLSKLRAVSGNLSELSAFSLEGVSLVLPQVLKVIGDPTPFEQFVNTASCSGIGDNSNGDINIKKSSTSSIGRSRSNSRNRSRTNSDETHSSSNSTSIIATDDLQLHQLITEYAKILNVLGDRLGSMATGSILMPHVMKMLLSLKSPTLLLHFIQSKQLWLVILSHAGPTCFLRSCLPLLLTYLVSGTLRATPRANRLMCRTTAPPSSSSSSPPLGAMPLWVNEERFSEEEKSEDWVLSFDQTDLFYIQEEALKVLVTLTLPDALGCGLCARYVLPALLCLVGNPRFSMAGFGMSLRDKDYNLTYKPKEILDPYDTSTSTAISTVLVDKKSYLNLFSNKIALLSEYDEAHMMSVRTVIGICQIAGEIVVTTTVLPKVFFEMLPFVFVNILNLYMPDMANTINNTTVENFASGPFLSALLEIIALLRGLLTTLSGKSIRSFYFNTTELSLPSGIKGGEAGGMSLLTLLIILPLPFINPDTESIDYSDHDSTEDEDYAKIMRLLEFRQRHSMFIELCRLITAAASQVGSDIIHNTILPAINKFFTKFVHTYCDLDVRSDLMALAFEIGRSLYIPMVQLVGADSFSTAVPDVNPRLEVWLLHSSSSEDVQARNSELNVLPDTIFPVAMSKQDIAPVTKPEKEKGFWGGFMPELFAPSPPRKVKPQTRIIDHKANKEAEARLNQKMDNAMRDAIAQQEVQRGLVQTPAKLKQKLKQHLEVDSDDDSIASPCPSTGDIATTFGSEEDDYAQHNEKSGDDICTISLDAKRTTPITRNKQTKSIMHYHGDNSFYHALHTFISDNEALRPSEKVYFKQQSKSQVPLSLVNSVGKLIHRSQSTSFHPSHSISIGRTTTKSTDDNVMSNFRKALKSTIQRSPSANKNDSSSSTSFGFDSEEEEDGGRIVHMRSEQAWLLGGAGRWIADTSPDLAEPPPPPPKAKPGMHSPVLSSHTSSSQSKTTSTWKKKPAAYISMAAPRVFSDAASEAAEAFTLNMMNETSWAFDALAYKANAAGAVNIMLADPTERFLVAGTKDGEMKVWSLMGNPVVELMKYSSHQAGVFSAGFLKSGTQVASCDGTIRIWDIETGMTIADLQRSHSELDVFNHLQVVSARLGVGQGDDQLITCAGAVLGHYDVRVGYMCSLNPISEWKLYTNFSNSSPHDLMSSVSLTCSASNENYVCIGSTMGTLWAYERRTGRPIHCWMGHDGAAILKIQYIDRHHIISVTERNCFCWNLHEAEPKKVYQVKNLPDCSAVMNTNTVFMHTFEDPSIVQVSGDGGGGQSPVHVLYCLAGHKISAGELNIKGGGDNHHSNNNHNHNTSNNNSSNANSITHKRPTGGTRDSEPDVRLTRSYFHDYNDNKLTKSRTQISSACLLPLRRIMLVGTSDGLIRVVV